MRPIWNMMEIILDELENSSEWILVLINVALRERI